MPRRKLKWPRRWRWKGLRRWRKVRNENGQKKLEIGGKAAVRNASKRNEVGEFR
jgi:hypothetical protein